MIHAIAKTLIQDHRSHRDASARARQLARMYRKLAEDHERAAERIEEYEEWSAEPKPGRIMDRIVESLRGEL